MPPWLAMMLVNDSYLLLPYTISERTQKVDASWMGALLKYTRADGMRPVFPHAWPAQLLWNTCGCGERLPRQLDTDRLWLGNGT